MGGEKVSILRTALEGFIEALNREQRIVRTKLDLQITALQAEDPYWTVKQSSGYIAAEKARADTLTLTLYRLQRLLEQAGDK